MISNQILQNTIDGLKGIARVDFCVLDTEGKELAATFDSPQDRSDAGAFIRGIPRRQSGDPGVSVFQDL